NAPLRPDWCFEEEEEDDNGPSNGFNPQFMEGIEGVTPVTIPSRLSFYQNMAQKFANWKRSSFPGCQPVSMTYQNIEFLTHTNYKVSWKADGTRYLMLIVDEKNIVF